jgi:hypothetical protein
MESRITTPPTTPGVHKGADQIKMRRHSEAKQSEPETSHSSTSLTNPPQVIKKEQSGPSQAEHITPREFIPLLVRLANAGKEGRKPKAIVPDLLTWSGPEQSMTRQS